MKIDVRLAKKNDLAEIGKIFMEVFNKAVDKGWTEKTVNEYMHYWFKKKPEMFLVGEIGSKIVGGAMGAIRPMPKGNELIDINVFVDIENQNQGTGKKIFKELIKKAVKDYNVTNIVGMADKTANFPMNWYKRIGFSQCRWVQIEGKPIELLKNL